MMKPSIQLRIGQQLTMTPQLQQAIRLLQLSTLELQAEIQQNFETNPMLETVDDEAEPEAGGEGVSTERTTEVGQQSGGGNGEENLAETGAQASDSPVDLPIDSSWEDIYDAPTSYGGGSEEGGRDLFENQSAGEE